MHMIYLEKRLNKKQGIRYLYVQGFLFGQNEMLTSRILLMELSVAYIH